MSKVNVWKRKISFSSQSFSVELSFSPREKKVSFVKELIKELIANWTLLSLLKLHKFLFTCLIFEKLKEKIELTRLAILLTERSFLRFTTRDVLRRKLFTRFKNLLFNFVKLSGNILRNIYFMIIRSRASQHFSNKICVFYKCRVSQEFLSVDNSSWKLVELCCNINKHVK